MMVAVAKLRLDQLPLEQKASIASEAADRALSNVAALCRRIDEWCDEQDRRRAAEQPR